MKSLTIKQPWASLIIRGAKDIENRNWKTEFRGLVAIHSSAKLDDKEIGDACCFMENFIPRFSSQMFRRESFPTGVILGIAEIVDCVKVSDSPWFCGEYGFVMRNPVAFHVPIPCRGALLFWDVPDNLMPQMRDQFRKAR